MNLPHTSHMKLWPLTNTNFPKVDFSTDIAQWVKTPVMKAPFAKVPSIQHKSLIFQFSPSQFVLLFKKICLKVLRKKD